MVASGPTAVDSFDCDFFACFGSCFQMFQFCRIVGLGTTLVGIGTTLLENSTKKNHPLKSNAVGGHNITIKWNMLRPLNF